MYKSIDKHTKLYVTSVGVFFSNIKKNVARKLKLYLPMHKNFNNNDK
jgi:hypothetical protein